MQWKSLPKIDSFTRVYISRELPVLSSIFIRKSCQLYVTVSFMRLQVTVSKSSVLFWCLWESFPGKSSEIWKLGCILEAPELSYLLTWPSLQLFSVQLVPVSEVSEVHSVFWMYYQFSTIMFSLTLKRREKTYYSGENLLLLPLLYLQRSHHHSIFHELVLETVKILDSMENHCCHQGSACPVNKAMTSFFLLHISIIVIACKCREECGWEKRGRHRIHLWQEVLDFDKIP